jgi:predicted ATPase/DNA-binding SARP family transcriptional activator
MNGSGQRIYLLGEPRVSMSDSTLSVRERVIALIAYLVLHRGQSLVRDVVAFALWPDSSETIARNNLRRHINLINTAFRNAGAEAPLAANHRTIGWNEASGIWVDLIAFERSAERIETAHEAVELYAGDFLLRQDYEWASHARERLRARAIALLDGLIDRAQNEGDVAAAIAFGRRLLQIDPWREDTVRKLIVLRQLAGDRAGAAQEYRNFAKALHEEVGAEPMPETLALLEAERAPVHRPAARHNVPTPVTRFLGRDSELEEFAALATAHRLVTVVGIGGIGKTRLAVEVAKRAAEGGTRGVWFVPLSAVADPALVPSAVMAALSLREDPPKTHEETLIGYLQPRYDLIVLDACENLRGAVARLCERLLTACPNLRIVATSRVVLSCTGEATYRLSPFAEEDGISLFCERAAAVLPSFKRTALNEPLIAHIVRRLDGIPLALELASARTNVMSLKSLARRLDDRFEIMSRERPSHIPGHRTLQAAIDWSYGLLSEEERILFARLAIFAGSWTLEMAEDVCAGAGLDREQIVDTLSSLDDKSLLQCDYQPDETRFRFLDTVRAYAELKLAAQGDAADVRRKHLEWCVAFAERTAPLLWGEGQGYALACIARETDNLRFAIESALAPGAPHDAALRLTAALGRYWFLQNIFAEGQAALGAALRQAGDDADRALVAEAMMASAYLFTQRRDYESGARLALGVLENFRGVAKDRTVILALMVASVCAIFGETGTDAGAFIEELERRAAGTTDAWTWAFPQYAKALAAMKLDDTPRAIALLEDALNSVRRLKDPYDICAIATQLGYSKLRTGDVSQAGVLFLESAERSYELNSSIALAQCTEGLAFVAAAAGSNEAAAQLFGAADALRAKCEAPRWLHWQTSREVLWTSARAQLGETLFDDLSARGYDLALSDPYAAIRHCAPSLRAVPALAAMGR